MNSSVEVGGALKEAQNYLRFQWAYEKDQGWLVEMAGNINKQ